MLLNSWRVLKSSFIAVLIDVHDRSEETEIYANLIGVTKNLLTGPVLDEAAEQKETALKDHRRESRIPEQFAGLLHGSSPACESPDNPYQLYSKVQKDPPPRHGNLLLAPNHAVPFPACTKIQKEPKPQVVYRTIFHTRVNQTPSVQGKGDVNRSGEGPNNSAGGYEERACTLGRMRSGMSKNVPDLQLSRSLSKSDSNLVVASPSEEEKRNSRGQNSPTRLERTPSFTAEWEEVITPELYFNYNYIIVRIPASGHSRFFDRTV